MGELGLEIGLLDLESFELDLKIWENREIEFFCEIVQAFCLP